jgi:hypothetical protein
MIVHIYDEQQKVLAFKSLRVFQHPNPITKPPMSTNLAKPKSGTKYCADSQARVNY